jgi:type I restriction enzyme S subunit
LKVNNLKVEDICDFIGGSQPVKSEFINQPKKGYVRLIQIRDYKSDAFMTYIPKDSTSKFCDENDIMIGRYGPPIFQICRGLKGAHNVALIKAEPKDFVYREFLYYFLKQDSVFKYVEKLSDRTGGQTGVDLFSLNKYPVRIPADLEDQKKIVTILVEIDKKIKINKDINANLESMIKLIFNYWFVQFEFPDEKDKAYKSSGGKMIYDNKLKREIPHNWEVAKFGKYNKIKRGELITKETIAPGNIKVVAAGLKHAYFHSTSNYKENTITVSASGANAGLINFWREPIFASDCIAIRGSSDINTFFAYYNLMLFQKHLLKQASGSAQPHVYPKDVSEINYIVPPKRLLEKFGNFVLPCNNKIAVNLRETETLTKLRDWLVPMLMNGQVKIK